jgi:RHS repeat-associated protein
MGYTGHRHNNLGSAPDDIGLIYMNARWYLPGLARFISADTLVPNPTNPQSFNRYSYVRNSPLNLTDPTGHQDIACETNTCGGGGGSAQVIPEPSSPPTPLGPPMNDYYLSGSNFSSYHEAVDVLSRNLDDKNVLASTVGTVRISDSCGDSCPGCYSTQTYDPCGYTLNETPANWGVGSVLIVEYLYESLPQDVIELLGLNPNQSLFFQYQHLSSISVSVGQEISLAMVIAQVGNTGISDGDHLHLEIKMGASGTFNNMSSYDATAINTWQNKRSGIPPLTVVDPNLLWDIP